VKYLLVTDTHLGLYNDSDVWLDVVVNLFDQIRQTCHRENIKKIIHLGDFFHNRKSINTKTQIAAQGIIDLLHGLDLFIIVGNHDTYYKNKIQPTSLRIFRKEPDVHVIEDTVFIDEIMAVPWGGEIRPTHIPYCMGHFAITGFNMNDSYVCKKGQDPSIFNQFQKVYSGHFHTPSNQGKITYLGSPYQQTFHDADSTRGYYIFENGEIDLIEFRKYPHFVKMNTENIRLGKISGNIIKLTFEKDYGTSENEIIINGIMKRNPHQIHVDFSKISYDVEDEPDEEMPDMIDHDGIIRDYVGKIEKPENINEKTLMDIMFNLTEEIKND